MVPMPEARAAVRTEDRAQGVTQVCSRLWMGHAGMFVSQTERLFTYSASESLNVGVDNDDRMLEMEHHRMQAELNCPVTRNVRQYSSLPLLVPLVLYCLL